MEYFEREGEGSAWSDTYLAGGLKIDKLDIVLGRSSTFPKEKHGK